MTKGRISIESVAAIANAIREKLGTTATYKPAEMAPAILSIPTGGTGEEIPKIYVAKKLEHQSIVITPSVLTTPVEIDDKLEYPLSVKFINIEVIAEQGYLAGGLVINGNALGVAKVKNYDIRKNDQITATKAVKLGETPVFDVAGKVTFKQLTVDDTDYPAASDGVVANISSGKGAIVNTSINTKYRVIDIYSVSSDDEFANINIRIENLNTFFSQFSAPYSVMLSAKIGTVELEMTRSMSDSIYCSINKSQFDYLKANIGKPLNFSIKYE